MDKRHTIKIRVVSYLYTVYKINRTKCMTFFTNVLTFSAALKLNMTPMVKVWHDDIWLCDT